MADILKILTDNLGKGLKTNQSLVPYTNFKIGGLAKYLFEARLSVDLTKACQVANELQLPIKVLGGGANILVSDNGFPGLVVITRNHNFSIEGNKVVAEAGVKMGFLASKTVAAGLTGFEPLVAVPGTIGGGIYGNAGLPQIIGGCIGHWVTKVTVLQGDKIVSLTKRQCKFGYRQSVFKQTGDIILEASFKLNKGQIDESRQLMKKYVDMRKNQPYHVPSSGCIFKNYELTNSEIEEVKTRFLGREKIEEFLASKQIPAAWLIDQAGLKGKQIGAVQISLKHANYIINLGGGTAEQVVMLISLVKQQVRDQFGIELREEVQYVGF